MENCLDVVPLDLTMYYEGKFSWFGHMIHKPGAEKHHVADWYKLAKLKMGNLILKLKL